ncbi:MAG: CPBP family intramembrane glutamic endopeptidase [Saprospiraceae bacterium]
MDEEIKTALLRVIPFLIVIVVIGIRIRLKKVDPIDIGLNKPSSYPRFFAWIFGFLALVLLIEFVLFDMGILEIRHFDHPLFSSIIRIVGAVVLAPIAEEMIFRGFILNLLRKKILNFNFAILIQSIIFVLLHNFTYENTLSSNIGIAQSLMDGCLFGYARYYTKSLYTPIAMHMTGNLIATIERLIF